MLKLNFERCPICGNAPVVIIHKNQQAMCKKCAVCLGCMFFSSNGKCRMGLLRLEDNCDHYSIDWIHD
jgi:uncharacterized membrane protein